VVSGSSFPKVSPRPKKEGGPPPYTLKKVRLPLPPKTMVTLRRPLGSQTGAIFLEGFAAARLAKSSLVWDLPLIVTE
jgi:hypothetical protein